MQVQAHLFVDAGTGQDRVLVDDFIFSVNYEQNTLLETGVKEMGTTTTANSRTCTED